VPFPNYFVIDPQVILCDGRDVHKAYESNPIDLAPGEKGKDIAVMIYVTDRPAEEKLYKAFPDGRWYDKKDCFGTIQLKWVVVPFEKIPETPGSFIYIRRVPKSYWNRRFYSDYGLARGLVLGEDRTARWNDDFPPSLNQFGHSVRVSGTWPVTESGTYQLELQTYNPTQLFVDGRSVLRLYDNSRVTSVSVDLDLSPGDHQVELTTAFMHQNQIPEVTVISKQGHWQKSLDELSGTTEGQHP